MAGSTTVLNHAGSTPSGTNQNGFSLGSNGNGRAEPSKGGKRPLPHIDDIVSVKIDIDPNASVERVIQTAEGHLRLAESSRTFGRPDTALKEYIMASLILVDAIKRNQGWVLLQDNRTQLDRYQRALRQVRVLQDDYEKIKADIKADNLRTGVQPTVSKHASSGGGPGEPAGGIRNGVRVGQGDVNGGADARKNGVPDRSGPLQSRTKPTVQPKPQALHGNVLHTTGPGASPGKTPEDLAQRFARLRASAPVQDPRIRTQTVIPPNSQSSQAMIEPPVSSSGSAGSAGGMPRLPDAIYNPARGTISNEAAELPSSAPRAMFTRTNSTTSISNVIKTPKAGPMEEYFVPANTYTASMAPLKRAKLTIPEGNTISAQDLVQYMGMGAKDVSVLLIDIRNRESFDEGHIMSQATICLEADVLMRQDISANEIADSNVLAPPDEMILFDKRHQFDLVVFYDQESDHITGKRDTPEQKAISGLYNALTQYDFPASLVKKTTTPKLLEGGLEAWSNLVGRGGLQTSSTSAAKNPRTSTPMTRSLLNKRPTYITRPIQDAEEARKWEETIADLGAMAPIRTTEDFLRRVPAISTIQESMVASPPTSPLSRPASPFYPRLSQEEIFYKNLPSPPTRPPPTLPRRSHSGLVDTEGGSGTLKKTLAKSNVEGARKYRTGLQNTGVICFANSSLQAMFATPGFSRELWSGQWTKSFGHPPQKPDEKIPNSQLLTRMLAAQFDFLSKGECPDVGTGVLMVCLLLCGFSGTIIDITFRDTSSASIQRLQTVERGRRVKSLGVTISRMRRNFIRSLWTTSTTRQTCSGIANDPKTRNSTLRRMALSYRMPSPTGATIPPPARPSSTSISAAWTCSSRNAKIASAGT